MRRWMSWVFLTIAIILHLVFISSLWTGLLNSLFYDTFYLVGQGADFFAFYQAGNNVLNGLDIYVRPDSLVVPYMYPYRYLAYFAYTFGVILNLVPPLLSYWLWGTFLIVAVWLASIRTRSLAKALGRPDWEGRVGMGMWFIFTPIYIELFMGQVTLIAGILLFFALTTPSFVKGQNHNGTMTSLWTFSGLMKLIPFLIAPVLLTAGRVRQVLAAIIVVAISIFLVPGGMESLQFFLNFNSARNMQIRPYPGNHSFKELLYYLLGEPTGVWQTYTLILMVLFFTLAALTTLYSRDVWICSGLFATAYFLTMSDVWEHHYSFLLPLLVLAWIRGRPTDKARWIPFVLVLLMSIPMLPITIYLSGIGPSANPRTMDILWQIIYHSSKALPALIFYLWSLVVALQSPRRGSSLMKIKQVFLGAWNGLIKGDCPPIEEGIIVYVNDEVVKEQEAMVEISNGKVS